ncbi:MAG: acetate kinase [Oscillospiraceae bacterium]|nr:acetate kinase [Oscillospiraceae bacterium]
MKILVVNAGSSSLKYQVFDMETESVLAKGNCERIGTDGSFLTHKHADGRKKEYHEHMPNHTAAIHLVFKALTDPDTGVISDMSEIGAVGHRVLHGGDRFSQSVLVTEEVEKAIEDNIPLGPLHNPANLMGIKACQEVMPGTPHVAVFDTAFHQTMPPEAFMYALPYEYYTKHKVRRYGFHGSSHRYVSAEAARLLGREGDPELKIVTCHLGNGSSFAAVKGGKCIDTSMGITPLEGIPMGTRSGSIDPAILQFVMDREHIDIAEMTRILNKESGMLGVSGISSDFRDLEAAAGEGNERAILARSMFIHSGSKLIASYAAVMGGVDAVVFTAGVGENDADIRLKMVEKLGFMGIAIDPARNNVRGKTAELSPDGAKVKVFLIPTNEELVIARDTEEIVEKLK